MVNKQAEKKTSLDDVRERARKLAALLDGPADKESGSCKPEHPRPQFARKNWVNLNGQWEFEVDPGDSGRERGLLDRQLADSIEVPFAPESKMSGIENTDFLNAVWYRKTLTVPSEWKDDDIRPVLHFGAVDHDTTVWVNGVEVARHRGGFTPFDADLDGVVGAGEEATVVVRARDLRGMPQARGKQATWYDSTHCQYTRTTGIWQTVWLEGVPREHIKSVKVFPNMGTQSFEVTASVSRSVCDGQLKVVVSEPEGDFVASAHVAVGKDLSPKVVVEIPAEKVRIWGPGDPELYRLTILLANEDGSIRDEISSYCGLRSISIKGNEFRINGKKIFQRLVLDQGYWPDSLMTAPSDDAIVEDIQLALSAGFNGARLHQKVFEERMMFWADMYGYLLWGEFGDWGVSGRGPLGYNQEPTASFVTQWIETLNRDISHPSIIGWCPLNETHQVLHDHITVLDDVTQGMYWATKLADPTRPVLDASGYSHRVRSADIYDSHSYEQDPAAFKREQAGLKDGKPYVNRLVLEDNTMPFADGRFSIDYDGQPFFVSEFGGIWWNEEEARNRRGNNDQAESWGYGDRVNSLEEFYERFEGLVQVLSCDSNMFGYCYTQLTDVFQEKNGIVNFDRTPKFDHEKLRAIQERTAAYEKE